MRLLNEFLQWPWSLYLHKRRFKELYLKWDHILANRNWTKQEAPV